MGRTTTGVKAITLRDEDIAVSMVVVKENEELLVISEKGFGKRTDISEYTLQRRGGKGIKTYRVTEKTGYVVGARIVKDGDELMLINSDGIIIRLNVADISTTSRNTMGVTLMKTGEDVNIVAMAKINYTDLNDEDIANEESEESLEEVNESLEQTENEE